MKSRKCAVLPTEIWTFIFQYLGVDDLKNISFVCKLFHKESLPYRWRDPHFYKRVKEEDLLGMVHLPITSINVSDLDAFWPAGSVSDGRDLDFKPFSRFQRIFKQMPRLKYLRLDIRYRDLYTKYKTSVLKRLLAYPFQRLATLPFVVHVHTRAMSLNEENWEEFLDVIMSHANIQVTLDRDDRMKGTLVPDTGRHQWVEQFDHFVYVYIMRRINQFTFTLTLGRLQALVDAQIIEVHTSVLDIGSGRTVEQSCHILKSINALQRVIVDDGYFDSGRYRFSPDDLRSLLTLPVRIVHISALRVDKDNVEEFCHILSEYDGLERLVIDRNFNEFRFQPKHLKFLSDIKAPIEVHTNALGQHSLSYCCFESEDIVELTKVLKTLNIVRVSVNKGLDGRGNCFTLPDFKLLCDELPVRELEMAALSFRKYKVKEFIASFAPCGLEKMIVNWLPSNQKFSLDELQSLGSFPIKEVYTDALRISKKRSNAGKFLELLKELRVQKIVVGAYKELFRHKCSNMLAVHSLNDNKDIYSPL